MFSVLFNERYIKLGVNAESAADFLQKTIPQLEKEGYVNKQYLQGILKREEEFPTGLATKTYPVAIPHGFPENVIKPGIFVFKMDVPIPFKQMGSDNETVEVKMIFLLIVTRAEDQVLLLQALVNKFMDQAEMDRLFSAKNARAIYVVLQSWFDEYEGGSK